MTQTKIKVRTEYHPVVLHTRPALEMDEEQIFEFCQLNRDWRIERSVEGDLEIMPPTGGETGNRNFELPRMLACGQDAIAAALASTPLQASFYPTARCALPTPPGSSANASRTGDPVLQGFALDLRPIWGPGF